MAVSNSAIGVFDSGIGGLTVAKAITSLLPNERLVYFGDTAHLPYGDKSSELIKSFSLGISKWLIDDKDCKAVVIACNTASAIAYEYLRDKHKGNIPIINVIDPIVEAVVKNESVKTIGLIATKTTIESGVYQEKLSRRAPNVKVKALATPLLVPMIEEGFSNDKISETVIENYLNAGALQGIDSLILGCTHYPLIRSEIDSFYKGKITLFDSTTIVANKLKSILANENLLSGKKESKNKFFVSDFTESFKRASRTFYKKEVSLKHKPLWD